MTEPSEPMDVPPPTSVYPTMPGYDAPNPGYPQGSAYAQGSGFPQGAGYPQAPGYAPGAAYAQGPGYPPNAAYTPYQSYGYPYPYQAVPAMALPNSMAITGMVLGLVGAVTSLFYIGGLIGIVGLVFSIVALRAIGRHQAGGRGMAVTGLVTSIVAIIITTVEIVLVVWVVHTATSCAQYGPESNPTQYNQCVRQGILGG